MVNTSRLVLRHVFLRSYTDFKRRLTLQLGSADLASEALQDTFLRLESATIVEPIQSPRAYLLRTAFNIAINRLVAERRRLTVSEVDALLGVADDAPSPDRIIEARSEIAALKRILAELPDRRRQILLAVCVEEAPTRQIASRFGVTVRTIQIEVKRALVYLSQRLDRKAAAVGGRRPQNADLGRSGADGTRVRVVPNDLNRGPAKSRAVSKERAPLRGVRRATGIQDPKSR